MSSSLVKIKNARADFGQQKAYVIDQQKQIIACFDVKEQKIKEEVVNLIEKSSNDLSDNGSQIRVRLFDESKSNALKEQLSLSFKEHISIKIRTYKESKTQDLKEFLKNHNRHVKFIENGPKPLHEPH